MLFWFGIFVAALVVWCVFDYQENWSMRQLTKELAEGEDTDECHRE